MLRYGELGVGVGIQITNPNASKDAYDAKVEEAQKKINPEPPKQQQQEQPKNEQIKQQPQ